MTTDPAQAMRPTSEESAVPVATLHIAQPRSWLVSGVLLMFLPAWLLGVMPLAQASARGKYGLMAYLALIALVTWGSYVRGLRTVRIDFTSGSIRVHAPGFFLLGRPKAYPLRDFRSVISYVVPGRFPFNRVDLVRYDTKSLLLADFTPASVSPSFWSLPADDEAPRACALRKDVAMRCGLEDAGFAGNRMWGAPVE